ncbi:MAG: hypothetical protein ACTHKV_08495 [Flavipsychrobacter sp.]
MGNRKFDDSEDDDFDFKPPAPTPVVDLPYYETLRSILEPYRPADDELHADKTFSSSEIIQAIEEHHGVPQGPVAKGDVMEWVSPDDFARAMAYCGFKAVNAGGLQLVWLMKKK